MASEGDCRLGASNPWINGNCSRISDKARDDAFRHEVVFVFEDEVFGCVPVVTRGVAAEELGRDVVFGFWGDLVAEFEAHHCKRSRDWR